MQQRMEWSGCLLGNQQVTEHQEQDDERLSMRGLA